MTLLEEAPDADGTTRERYYYDTLKPLYNCQVPGRTRYEWHHSDKRKDYEEGRRESNREYARIRRFLMKEAST